MSNTMRAPHWTLTSAAFEQLLAALDSDRERAAVAYERLRERIAGLFQWWGAGESEALADQTLDRVARKIEEGADIRAGALGAYVRGVARMVFHESSRRPRLQPADAELLAHRSPSGRELHERFETCLAMLDPVDRQLVLRYYAAGKAVDVRRQLASELRISPTALRIRAHRIRERLERLVSATLEPA